MEQRHNQPLDLMADGSQFRFFSLGVVAENKEMSKTRILVTPIEVLGMVDGELKSSPEKLETEGLDYDYKEYKVAAIADTTIEADWMPLNEGNRRTPPDVRRGERVMLYQYGDEQRFFWQPFGLDGRLRKLETAIYSWSATKNEKEDSEQPENSYYLEVSTHEKRVTFATSKKNGEKCRYAIEINPGEGRVLVTDDKGNEILMDSVETRVYMKNADDSEIDITKQDIKMKASKDITLDAGQNITMTAGTKITMKAPNVEIDGDTKVTKTFKVVGTSDFDGAMTASGIVSDAAIQGPTETI